MRWAVWIGAVAVLVAGCAGGREKLSISGWRGVPSEDAGVARDANVARDGSAAKDAGPAKDGPRPRASNDGGVDVDAAMDAGQQSVTGSSCTRAADCASGFCADGVCCTTACTGRCVSCTAAGRVGTCVPVDVGAPEPHGLCVAQGPASCGLDGTCDGVGACAFYPAGTECAVSSCTGTVLTLARTCDGQGSCGSASAISCAPFLCVDGACYIDCVSSDECVVGATCTDGICEHWETAACTVDAECASGHCAQGVCCASACTAPCSSCALPGTMGTCEPDPSADPSTCG